MSFDIAIGYFLDLAPLADLRADIGEVLPQKEEFPGGRVLRERAINTTSLRIQELNNRALLQIIDAFGGETTRPLEASDLETLAASILVFSSYAHTPISQSDAKNLGSSRLERKFQELEDLYKFTERLYAQGESAEAGNPEFAWAGHYLLELAGMPKIKIDPTSKHPSGLGLLHNTKSIWQYTSFGNEIDDHYTYAYQSIVEGLGKLGELGKNYQPATERIKARLESSFKKLCGNAEKGEEADITSFIEGTTYQRLYCPETTLPAQLKIWAYEPDETEHYTKLWHAKLIKDAREAGIELTICY